MRNKRKMKMMMMIMMKNILDRLGGGNNDIIKENEHENEIGIEDSENNIKIEENKNLCKKIFVKIIIWI